MQTMTTLTFLYVMLPVAMAVFLLCPPSWRAGGMLLASLAYYYIVQRGYLPLLILCIGLDWLALAVMSRWDHNPRVRRACAAFSVGKSLLLVAGAEAFFRMNAYADTVLGLHVVALSSMSCVLETYRGLAPHERSPVSFALYCCFFPRLEGGPLIPYRKFAPQLESPNPSFKDILGGLGTFAQGAVKSGVLGSALLELHGELTGLAPGEQTVAGTWCTLLVLALSVYYRFSGLSVMARGIGRMMGLSLPQNFYFPYQSRSVTDFFQRFNSTFTAFLERNVYQPLAARGRGKAADCCCLLLVGVLFGLWFGLRPGYLVWGLYLGAFLALEKHAYPGVLAAIPTVFTRFYTLCVVLAGFTLFGGGTLGAGLATLGNMFGLGGLPLFNDRLGYLLSSNWLLLVAGLVFATSAFSLLLGFLQKKLPRLAELLEGGANLALLIAFTAFSL